MLDEFMNCILSQMDLRGNLEFAPQYERRKVVFIAKKLV